MVYVALLRGVNVGGSNKIDMKELKAVFEAAGMTAVRTYINSGNVIFHAQGADQQRLAGVLEQAIEARFGFPVRVLVRDIEEIGAIVASLPPDWANDETMKCDVFFLWDEVDDASALERLDYDPAVDDVRYTPGALLRCVRRRDAGRSRVVRIVGTPFYESITTRNCNTARKLLRLMSESAARE